MIVHENNGGRRIELFLPFRCGRKMIRSITLRPITWDHTLKWQNGDYGKSMELLFDLTVEPESVVRCLRYPDVERVMNQFFEMIPPEIREAIAAGQIPQRVPVEVEPVAEPEVAVEEPVVKVSDKSVDPITKDTPIESYDPYRPPTKAEIEEDAKAHPPPKDPFAHIGKSEMEGLGFELDEQDGR